MIQSLQIAMLGLMLGGVFAFISDHDAGHRARCGYRCDDEAATRESENARLRYA